ncbi:MAG: DUF2064 domain-containing protein [Chitinispirillales bacterium]|jgi:glycosyltransferase A (GT-A) superfamily protein (DUF2064 family)|nr:DUF2064 domain-containing protein [Chitinispirillales bacterium]
MKNILIILAKSPEPHNVKTRMIYKDIISAKDAAMIYQELLFNLANQLIINEVEFHLCVNNQCISYFNDSIFNSIHKLSHNFNNIGKIIKHVIKNHFETENDKLIISVSDVIYPTVDIICHSFELLEKKDVVLGKSSDGGFYLIGLKKELNIFSDIEWSTDKVFGQMEKNMNQQNLTFSTLNDIPEIDTVDDLKKIYKIYMHNKDFQQKYPFTWKKTLEII